MLCTTFLRWADVPFAGCHLSLTTSSVKHFELFFPVDMNGGVQFVGVQYFCRRLSFRCSLYAG